MSNWRIVYSYDNKERSFEPTTCQFLVGRPKAGISVDLDLSPDLKVSRPHARITRENGELWIEDLGSTGGTYVGHRKIPRRMKSLVRPGETVRMGETVLRVELPTDASVPDIDRTVELPPDGNATEISYICDAGTNSFFSLATNKEERERLALLCELPLLFVAQKKIQGLLETIVQRLIEIIPGASRAAVLLRDRSSGQLVLKANFPKGAPSISLTCANRAIERKEGFVWRRSADITRSQERHAMQSSIYAPLIWEGAALGVVCVDNSDAQLEFRESDLCLLTGVAHYAAMAVENYYARDDLRRHAELTSRLFCNRFPPRIREDLIRDASAGTLVTGTRESDVTVLAADIRGFTRLSARLGPKRMKDILDQYFPPLIDAIHENDGTIERFVGDAIFAVFGSPRMDENQSEHALRAALKMQASVATRNYLRTSNGDEICTIGVGLHCGPALHGFVGNAKHMEFAVLGDPANLAGRYCSGAGSNEILISPDFYARIFHLATCESVVISTKHEGHFHAYRLLPADH